MKEGKRTPHGNFGHKGKHRPGEGKRGGKKVVPKGMKKTYAKQTKKASKGKGDAKAFDSYRKKMYNLSNKEGMGLV